MQNKSKLDATQAARDWEERGVYTVPLHESSKQPVGKGWQKLRLVSDDFGKRFKPGNNIGGIWGEPSDWAVDLDLDLDTAPAVAQHIIPYYLEDEETFVYGRREKPWSHYIFRCVGAETKKWQVQGEEECGMVVEIRSTGAQSVLPPSRHPNGDRYVIEHEEEFYDIKKLILERAAEEIAIAGVMLYYYPGRHGRHDYVHACTGALCHSGWGPDKIKRVMAAVLSEVQDEDEEIKDRLGSVVNTIEHYSNDNRIKGFTSLEEFMSTKAIQQLRQWVKGGKKERQLELPPPKLARGKKELLAFRPEWLQIPGLVGDVAAWAGKRAYVRQPIFDLATGIMCTALASNNNYVVQTWDTPLSPYLMVAAPTGSGKDSILSAVAEFGTQIGIDQVFRGFQSYYALLDILAEEGHACLIWDEAARNLAAAKNVNGPDFSTITHIISLYGAGNKIIPATPGRKQTIPDLVHPFLTVLATAQPDMLMSALTSAAEETGFVNRFYLFDVGTELAPLNRKRVKVFPSAIKKLARMLAHHEPTGGEFTEVTFGTAKVVTMFQEYEETARRRTIRKEYTWSRANQNALILAGTAAVGIDPYRPVIDEDIATWAMDIVNWSCENWMERIRLTGGQSFSEQQSFLVEKVIRRPQDYYNLARDAKQHKQLRMLQQGFMHPSVLARATRSIPKYRREEILNELHEAELIGSTDKDGITVYFAKE